MTTDKPTDLEVLLAVSNMELQLKTALAVAERSRQEHPGRCFDTGTNMALGALHQGVANCLGLIRKLKRESEPKRPELTVVQGGAQ